MLFLHPRSVSFGSASWDGVVSVAIGRVAARSVVEFGDNGPHIVMADVPEQRVDVTVVQELAGDDLASSSPGDSGSLRFEAASNASGAARKRVSMTAVVMSVKYLASGKGGSQRTVTLVAVADDGDEDPVTVADL
ncbi:MAG: hypothetical protein H6810_03560 [Phycisphaeraceae bacterium]|nr:MAG: hypothetical protein H6810_03560 [Phycisphaeraceae bacterium]